MRGRCGVPCEKASHIALKCARLSLMYAALVEPIKLSEHLRGKLKSSMLPEGGGAAKRAGAVEENYVAK